jgi:hypothetical protein
LLQRAEGRVRVRVAGLRRRSANHAELPGGEGHARSAKEAAAVMINFFGRFDCMQ